jgi:hypothetical protein
MAIANDCITKQACLKGWMNYSTKNIDFLAPDLNYKSEIQFVTKKMFLKNISRCKLKIRYYIVNVSLVKRFMRLIIFSNELRRHFRHSSSDELN